MRTFCHYFGMKDLNFKLGEIVYFNTNLVRFKPICDIGTHLLVFNIFVLSFWKFFISNKWRIYLLEILGNSFCIMQDYVSWYLRYLSTVKMDLCTAMLSSSGESEQVGNRSSINIIQYLRYSSNIMFCIYVLSRTGE